MNYEQIVRDLVTPLVDKQEALLVRQMPSATENEVLILVYAESNDIARLIGRGGSMAEALREVVNIAGKLENKRIKVKLESFSESLDEEKE